MIMKLADRENFLFYESLLQNWSYDTLKKPQLKILNFNYIYIAANS